MTNKIDIPDIIQDNLLVILIALIGVLIYLWKLSSLLINNGNRNVNNQGVYQNQTNDSSRNNSPGNNIGNITGHGNHNNSSQTIVNRSAESSDIIGSITGDNNSGNKLRSEVNNAEGNITQNVIKRSGNKTIIKNNNIRKWNSTHS